MKHFSLLALLFLISSITCSQGTVSKEIKRTTSISSSPPKSALTFKKRKAMEVKEKKDSQRQIVELKGGALLVRLQTRRMSIAALDSLGRTKEARKVEAFIKEKNLKIINAFRDNYDYSAVYFFESHYSSFVRKFAFDSVIFLNQELIPDSNIQFNDTVFLTAEITLLKADDYRFWDHNSLFLEKKYVKDKDGHETVKSSGVVLKPIYYTGQNMRFEGLIFKDNQIVQLHRPFPYYTRTFPTIKWIRSTDKVVKRMNKKLHEYHNEF